MPIFTVTVRHDTTGETKTVSVNTDTMEASVVPPASVEKSVEEPLYAKQGGRRSTRQFRLKKRRITRKLKKDN